MAYTIKNEKLLHCRKCHKSFRARGHQISVMKYCSAKCRANDHRSPTARVCKTCGNPFKRKLARGRPPKFCSEKCRKKFNAEYMRNYMKTRNMVKRTVKGKEREIVGWKGDTMKPAKVVKVAGKPVQVKRYRKSIKSFIIAKKG